MKEQLFELARSAAENAYAPYSHFSVGAAALAGNGVIYAGCNIENASYGLTMCAERVAIFQMVAAGYMSLKEIAIVSQNGSPPCGACLQVMSEVSANADATLVHLCDLNGVRATHTLKALLPISFGPEGLVRTE